jgi:hypothetical protein
MAGLLWAIVAILVILWLIGFVVVSTVTRFAEQTRTQPFSPPFTIPGG